MIKLSHLIKENKTFQQIQNEQDPDGTKHDLRLTCIKCGATQTCRCSKPKRKFNGICHNCSQLNEIEYPLAKGKDLRSYEGMEGWKGKLIWMEPDKFLHMVKPMGEHDWNEDSSKNIEHRLRNNLPVDPCVLEVDVEKRKIVGHEGRHRATIAKKLDIQKIPVLIYTGSNFKRVPQWDHSDHDMIDKVHEFKPEYLKENKEGTEPNIYYHVTKGIHLKKIQKYGLKPRQKAEWSGMFKQDIRQHKGVFVFDNYYEALKWSFKMQWQNKGEKIVILKLKTQDTDFIEDTHWESTLSIGKWLVKQTPFKPEDLVEILPFDIKQWNPELTAKIKSLELR